MRVSTALSRILVISLLLLIVSSALAWDSIYRRASSGSRRTADRDAMMVIENGGRVAPAPDPRQAPGPRPARGVEPRPSVEPAPTPQPIPKPTPAPDPGVRKVTIRKGDNLTRVAKRALGNGNRWKEIAALNGIPAPYVIHPGRTLTVPTR